MTPTPGKTVVEHGARSLTFIRAFPVPREVVFEAFSSADAVRRWWGPGRWPVVECTLDFRPGGIWHYCLRGPDGSEHWAHAVFSQIARPERIVFLERTSDQDGRITNAMPGALNTVSFSERNGVTTLTSLIEYDSTADRDHYLDAGQSGGYCTALDQLGAALTQQEWTS